MKYLDLITLYEITNNNTEITVDLIEDTFVKNSQGKHDWLDFEQQIGKVKQYCLTYKGEEYQVTLQCKGKTFIECNKRCEDYFNIEFQVLEIDLILLIENTQLNKLTNSKDFRNKVLKRIGVTKEQVINDLIGKNSKNDRYDISSQIKTSKDSWLDDTNKSMIYLISSFEVVSNWHGYVGQTKQDNKLSRWYSEKYWFGESGKLRTGDLLLFEKAKCMDLLLVDSKVESEVTHFETLMINYCAYKLGKHSINDKQVGKNRKQQRQLIIKELVWVINSDIEFHYITMSMRYLGVNSEMIFKTMHKNKQLVEEWSQGDKHLKALINTIINTTDITVQEISDNMPHIDKEVTIYVKSNNNSIKPPKYKTIKEPIVLKSIDDIWLEED